MTNLVQSLFRIDPTEGLVQYANAVKPYHSKILDVLVEYIYTEKVDVSMKERWSWKMTFERPKVDTVYTCGYGLVWDPYRSTTAAPPVNIISAQSTQSLPITILSVPSDASAVSISSVGYNLTNDLKVTLRTDGTLPTSVPQVAVGKTYGVSGHNASFHLIDLESNQAVSFMAVGTGTTYIEPANIKFNSFLVSPDYGPDFKVAVINTKANQLAFVNTFAISAVNAAMGQWVIGSDIRPMIPVSDVKYDDTTLSSVAIAGNCSFSFMGNQESYFGPSTTFNIVGGPNAGTYTVADSDSGRALTRFDGTQTIVPVNQIILNQVASGTAQVAVTTMLPIGSNLFVNNNTGIGGNGRYTVSGVAVVGNTTVVTVSETVSMLAAGNGNANIIVRPAQVPAWPTGLLVRVHSTGTMPLPLVNNTKLFYSPTTTPGVFNLSTKRYPVEYSDYVDLTSLNSGVVEITRAEIFNPGAYIKVSGSYLNKNDGNYIIRKTEDEGSYVRVYVMEKIPFTTPQNRAFDGLMEFNFDSYDAPVYCPVSQAGDMHADTFIHEKIVFEYSFHLSDSIRTAITEYTSAGFGSMPFGSTGVEYGLGTTPTRSYTSPAYGTAGAPTGTIIPHGIDMQLFDIGGIDETLQSVSRNYGKVV